MRDLLILLVHLITTTARLMGPGGARSVIAESLLVWCNKAAEVGESPRYGRCWPLFPE